jgi:ATP/ADP translocase
VCSVDEAKTLYPKLGIAANVGLVLAGSFTRLVNEGVARGDAVLSVQVRPAPGFAGFAGLRAHLPLLV